MKNITLSADDSLIEHARLYAKEQRKTLNALFREWLEELTARRGNVEEYRALMRRLKHIKSTGPYTRDEMNER